MRRLVCLLGLVMGLSTPASAQEAHPKLAHALLATSFVLHGMDNSVSMYRFGQDPQRFREANPLLRPLQNQPEAFGAVKMGMATGINWFLLEQHKKHPKLVVASLIINNSLMLVVVGRNARVTR